MWTLASTWLSGSATTDFGVPDVIPARDGCALDAAEAARQAAIVEAAWSVLGAVAAKAPAALRKGTRGGGRDRDEVVTHVVGAEISYARKIGVRHRGLKADDGAGIAAMRQEVLGVLLAARSAQVVVEKGWPPRYAARRVAWHVLDHAWEIEDKST